MNYQNGDFQPHLALVISNDDINEFEGYYITVMLSSTPSLDDYSFLLNAEMFNFDFKIKLKSPNHRPQVRCHLISAIKEDDLFIQRRYGTIKKDFFKKIIQQISEKVFGQI